jgi:hypothetical protein
MRECMKCKEEKREGKGERAGRSRSFADGEKFEKVLD